MIPLFVAPVVGMWFLYNALIGDHTWVEQFQKLEKFKPGLADLKKGRTHMDRLRMTDLGQFVDEISKQFEQFKKDHGQVRMIMWGVERRTHQAKVDIQDGKIILAIICGVVVISLTLTAFAFHTNRKLLRQAKSLVAQGEPRQTELKNLISDLGQKLAAIKTEPANHYEKMSKELTAMKTDQAAQNEQVQKYLSGEEEKKVSTLSYQKFKEETSGGFATLKKDLETQFKGSQAALESRIGELSSQLEASKLERATQQEVYQTEIARLSAENTSAKREQSKELRELHEYLKTCITSPPVEKISETTQPEETLNMVEKLHSDATANPETQEPLGNHKSLDSQEQLTTQQSVDTKLLLKTRESVDTQQYLGTQESLETLNPLQIQEDSEGSQNLPHGKPAHAEVQDASSIIHGSAPEPTKLSEEADLIDLQATLPLDVPSSTKLSVKIPPPTKWDNGPPKHQSHGSPAASGDASTSPILDPSSGILGSKWASPEHTIPAPIIPGNYADFRAKAEPGKPPRSSRNPGKASTRVAPSPGLSSSSSASRVSDRCTQCGRAGHNAEGCWVKNKCTKCSRMGHFARDCWRDHQCCRCGADAHFEFICRHRLETCPTCGKQGHLASMCPSTNADGCQKERFWTGPIPEAMFKTYHDQPEDEWRI